MVRPLTKEELEVEANAWFQLLRNKARQIAAARLGVKRTNEAITTTDEQQALDSLKKAELVQQTVDNIAKKTEEKLKKQAQETLGVNLDESAAQPDESLAAQKPAAAESQSAESQSKEEEKNTARCDELVGSSLMLSASDHEVENSLVPEPPPIRKSRNFRARAAISEGFNDAVKSGNSAWDAIRS